MRRASAALSLRACVGVRVRARARTGIDRRACARTRIRQLADHMHDANLRLGLCRELEHDCAADVVRAEPRPSADNPPGQRPRIRSRRGRSGESLLRCTLHVARPCICSRRGERLAAPTPLLRPRFSAVGGSPFSSVHALEAVSRSQWCSKRFGKWTSTAISSRSALSPTCSPTPARRRARSR
jgi:hypothetical protein